MRSAPTFEVMITTVFLKSTVRPCASVSRPSSRIWSRMLKTSGCAFSISSKSTTGTAAAASLGQLARLVVADVAGRRADQAGDGVPLLELAHVEAGHQLSSPNRYSASARASSVLPTPVGPRKRKLPIGRFGSPRPARERRPPPRPPDSLVLADHPAVQVLLQPHQPLALLAHELWTGMPVPRETTSAMSSGVTSGARWPDFRLPSSSPWRDSISSRKVSAPARSPRRRPPGLARARAAAVVLEQRVSSSSSSSVATRAPASSIRSIALSGRKRSLM